MADTLTSPMHVEIISPDGPIYKADGVEMIVARAEDGEFAIMKNHLPLASALDMCSVRIHTGDKEQKVAIFGGFLENKDNKISIIAPLAELAENIDEARAKEAEKRATERIKARKAGTDIERAKLALKRAKVRLKTIQK